MDRKRTYKYNHKGNEIELNGYDADGGWLGKITYKYDNIGNKIEKNVYDSDGILKVKTTYKYDDKTNMIEENMYDVDGSLLRQNTRKYDNKRNRVEESSYEKISGEKTTVWNYKYEFDNKKNWTRKIVFIEGVAKYIIEREIEYHK